MQRKGFICLIGHSPPSWEAKAGTPGRRLEVRTEAETIEKPYFLACFHWLAWLAPSLTFPVMALTACSRLGPSTSTSNLENAYRLATGNLMVAFSHLGSSAQTTPAVTC